MREEITKLVDRLNQQCKADVERRRARTDVMMRYKLILPDYDLTADITLDVMNWEELKTDYKRDGFSGIMLEQSNDFQVCRDAKRILSLLFMDKGIYAKARIQTWKRDRKAVGTYLTHPEIYTLALNMKIDFLTYTEHDLWTTFTCQVDIIQEYIKAHKNVKYDIDVKDIVNPMKWVNTRIEMECKATYTFPEINHQEIDHYSKNYEVDVNIPIYFNGVEAPPDIIYPDMYNVSAKWRADDVFKAPAFFIARNEKMNITLNMDCKVTIPKAYSGPSDYVRCYLRVIRENNIVVTRTYYPEEEGDVFAFYLKEDSLKMDLKENDRIVLDCKYLDYKGGVLEYMVVALNTSEGSLTLTWRNKGKQLPTDVIEPNVLLQRLVDNMTGQNPDATNKEYTGVIEWEDADFDLQIVAAESIRGIEKAVLHTSYYDFNDWLATLGYEPYYEGANKMIYMKRDRLFQREQVSIELDSEEVSELVTKADNSYAYTSVDVGYKKQNYNSPNGRFEVMGTFNYSTGFVSYSDKVLKIISPYRADCIGIELLCWERLKRTTDTKSDNDVFVVALKNFVFAYVSYEDEVINSEGIKLYNAPLSPEMLVKYNESKIGVCTDRLKLESSDAYREATKNGVKFSKEDVKINKKLFEPISYEFKTSYWQEIPIELDATGVVRFLYRGVTYQGYVRWIKEPYGGREATDWQLQVVR